MNFSQLKFDTPSIIFFVLQIIVPLLPNILKNFIYDEQTFDSKITNLKNILSNKERSNLKAIVRSYFYGDGTMILEEPENNDLFDNYAQDSIRTISFLSTLIFLQKLSTIFNKYLLLSILISILIFVTSLFLNSNLDVFRYFALIILLTQIFSIYSLRRLTDKLKYHEHTI